MLLIDSRQTLTSTSSITITSSPGAGQAPIQGIVKFIPFSSHSRFPYHAFFSSPEASQRSRSAYSCKDQDPSPQSRHRCPTKASFRSSIRGCPRQGAPSRQHARQYPPNSKKPLHPQGRKGFIFRGTTLFGETTPGGRLPAFSAIKCSCPHGHWKPIPECSLPTRER